MEMKSGYKQTEAGVIPNEWEVVPIGSLIFDYRGGASLKPSDFTSMGVKVLPKGGVGRTGWLNVAEDEQKYCSPEYAAANYRNQVDETYTIVVLRDLVPSGPSIGLIVQIRDKETYVLAQGVYGFKVNEKAVPGYLVHLSNTNWYRKMANSIMVGSTQVHITNTAYKKVLIPLPPLAEQEAIAEALSDADALIKALEQLLAKKRQVKQGAMQELLTGKKRLAGTKKTEIVQTELGRFPADWILTPLGTLVDPNRSIRYGIVQPGDYDRQGRFMIRGQDYSKGWVASSEVFRVSDAVEAKYKNARVKTGDLIMTIVGTCGLVETIPDWLDGANLTQTTARVAILPSKANSAFCKYMLQTEAGSLQVNNFMKGAVQPGLNCADVEKFLIPLPADRTEQTAIAEILSDMDAEVTALEAKLSKAREVKAGMMQELLTGRIRLV